VNQNCDYKGLMKKVINKFENQVSKPSKKSPNSRNFKEN